MDLLLLLLSACITIAVTKADTQIQTYNDEDLLNLIRSGEEFVVVFTKKNNCAECVKLDTVLPDVQEDLKEISSLKFVQTFDSSLIRLYSHSQEPAMVYFRQGIPLLYDGPLDRNEIVLTLANNAKPIVKELTDDTFEHLTQAASGATTGDWFVLFYSTSCVECQRLSARWEAVGAAVKSRGIVVARADRGGLAAATAKRFKVTEDPTFILFRRGKMYRYQLTKYDPKSLISFAQDWYKNVKSEDVPSPQTPFDELVTWCVQMIKEIIEMALKILAERPWIWQIGLAGFGLVGLTSIIAVVKARSHLKQS